MNSGSQPGFSLLELLVTLFVVVLVTTVVTLSVSSGGQDVRLESTVRNLADVAGYALDEAQLLGRNYGLLLQRDSVDAETVEGYQWREWDPEAGWRAPESGKDIFAPQNFPEDIELQLELEDVPVVELPQAGGEVQAEPQVVLYASGETTAGAIDVRRRRSGELLWRVEWDLLGRFKVMRRGEEQEEPID